MPKRFTQSDEGFHQLTDEELAAIELSNPEVFQSLLTEESSDVKAWALAEAKKNAIERTSFFANSIRERIAASKHYLQAARWPIQLAAAQAIKAGQGSEFDTSIMAREARLRGLGETVDQLADKVLANSLIFASVGAAVDGIERATMDAIAAYSGSDPAHFETILSNAKAVALAEFLDIFGAVYGPAQAQARAAQFFGPLEVAE